MMTADVTKISCEFVRKVKLYLSQSKYFSEPCLDEVYFYHSKYMLATSLVDCLTYEEKCELSNLANTIIAEPTITPIIFDCDNQATVILTKSSSSCSYTVRLEDLNGIITAFPAFQLTSNEEYQSAFINVKVVGCSESYVETVESGCFNISNSSAPYCSDDWKLNVSIKYSLNGLLSNSTGYIKTLRIYETDSDGLLVNTPIDLNLSPSNLASWTSCPSCSGITASHLYFGHANWKNAFLTLLNNVTYTQQGALNSKWSVETIPTSNVIQISSGVKHLPTSEWLGINKNDFKVDWVNNSNTTITNVSPSITYSGTTSYMAHNFSVATDCGNVTGRVVMNQGNPVGNITGSNFNEVVITGDYTTNKPASIVNLEIPDCTKTLLTASVSSTEEVLTTEWFDGDDNLISEELTASTTDSGTFTFTVTLESGCTITETITV